MTVLRQLRLLVHVCAAMVLGRLLTQQLQILHRLGHHHSRRPPASTKTCPSCGDPNMVPLHSTNEKICPSCAYSVPWMLTGDQQATHQPHRATRKANTP
ncbi:hypothetical protein [Pseudomonas sp. PS01301]|uniref:hypothetical protein n=1 Tax=Pseudomonas sp. PS01301 TaxID=2991437 RepID=UPI00249C106C|nr:hypothetical protein [Pseudomonas sp. PS01301]